MKKPSTVLGIVLLFLGSVPFLLGQPVPAAKPEEVGMSSKHLAYLDQIIGEALQRKDFPGAVLLVTRKG
ncbi:MAG: esterase, partial [Candidatus Aminicenantales bacterium]